MTTKRLLSKQLIPELFPRDLDDERCNSRLSRLQLLISDQIQGDVEEEIELSRKEIDYQDSSGITALCWAIQCGKTDIAKILLSHNADPERPDFRGLTPLHIAALFDHNSIPLLLDAGVSPDIRDKTGETPLHAAARCGHWDPASYMSPLLDAGADINARDSYGYTPLFLACREVDNDAAIEYLIQRGADINLTDFEGLSPIDFSIQWEHADYVEILLEAGAESCSIDVFSSNILHNVARWGNIETMQVLIEWRRRLQGLDVNLKDKDGDTPLACVDFRDEAASGEWAETFDELISAILEIQDGATDESEESDGEGRITIDDDEDSQDDYETSDIESDGNGDDDSREEDSLEEDEGSEKFADALEVQDEVADGESS